MPGPGADWRTWDLLGRGLAAGEGVHRPSEFSALLASTLGDTGGMTVLDAGCGAGLIAIAALAAGAARVVAMDRDPAALESTATNVERHLGGEAAARLELWGADFAGLGERPVDVLAVNPPQRPVDLLDGVEPAQRHLHTGAGADGLDGLRLVLAHAAAAEVRTTAAPALNLAAAPRFEGWGPPLRLTGAVLPLHPAWNSPDGHGEVGIWAFRTA